MIYNPKKIEKKWQEYLLKNNLDKTSDDSSKPKFYCLDMFPYPSGAGLHVGHVESYTITDIYSRFMKMRGFNVLHPQGWDAFGLPAENYAIKTKIHPKITTKKALNNFKRQIKSMGFSYDWSREINTSDPEYYKWTQWIFIKLYENGLAYQKKAAVNWCESCQTVLAREQVVDGKCERCGNIVIQKELKQWFFKITDYAEKLLDGLEDLDWPESIKLMQKNWIGKSEGALIKFPITNLQLLIEVYTTRPDTIFGATYLVLAPEHELIEKIKNKIKNLKDVEKYITKTQKKTELERTSLEKVKSGIELKGITAINPATKKEIPVYIADYVLTTYGTGAIMGVPAHDERDNEFAKKFKLPIIKVIKSRDSDSEFFTGSGTMINSDKFNGKDSLKIKSEIIKYVGGKNSIQYKLRDWLVSRQRYWGAPIPIIYCDKCGILTVPEKDLPVKLPDDVDFKPTGESPIVRSKTFHNVKCPKCGLSARRESDTMDTFVCSSWYYLAYAMQEISNFQFPLINYKNVFKKWLPVDLYIGGKEHATGHLIFSRFISKALNDLEYINFIEPFLKLRNQGIIIASDGRKMSKSLGNVINPDDVVKKYGADSLRMYEMFMGPIEDQKPWDTQGIIGIYRFLEKVWKAMLLNDFEKTNDDLINITIKKVTKDIENLSFNTAISAMMIFINSVLVSKTNVNKEIKEKFLKILFPFAPHICEELWSNLGNNKSIGLEKWPKYIEIIELNNKIVVQINGKVRGRVVVKNGLSEASILEIVKKEPNIEKYIMDKKIKKVIYVSGKLISIVV